MTGTGARHTILVVDDHPLFRKGVVQLLELEPSFEVVGEAGDYDGALRLASDKEPDLTLLDLLKEPNVVKDNALVTYFKIQPRAFAGDNIAYLKQATARSALRRFFTGAAVN